MVGRIYFLTPFSFVFNFPLFRLLQFLLLCFLFIFCWLLFRICFTIFVFRFLNFTFHNSRRWSLKTIAGTHSAFAPKPPARSRRAAAADSQPAQSSSSSWRVSLWCMSAAVWRTITSSKRSAALKWFRSSSSGRSCRSSARYFFMFPTNVFFHAFFKSVLLILSLFRMVSCILSTGSRRRASTLPCNCI